MRLQIAILSLVALTGCSEWDRHRPYIAPEPVVQKPESVFSKLCDAIIEKSLKLPEHTDSTFLMLYNEVGAPDDCNVAVQRILALKHLDISRKSATRATLDLNLIASLEKLEVLILRQHYVQDLSPLQKLPNLAVLDASETDFNQDLSVFGLDKLPLENYRSLRLSVPSLDASKDRTITQLTRRFKKSLGPGETLVRALIDRGTKIEPIKLDSDATKNPAIIRAWQTGIEHPRFEDLELGTFFDSTKVSEVAPYVVYNRGYLLHFKIVDNARDSEAARAHLLEEFADAGQGNSWTYPPSEPGSGLFQILIQPTVPTETPTGRSGSVLNPLAVPTEAP